MKELFEVLAKLISEFSWKRFLGLLLAVVIAVLGLALYERFTNNFRLSRLQKEAEILSTLQDIEKKGPIVDPTLNAIYLQITQELQEASVYRPWTLRLPSISLTPVSKFIAGTFLWLGCAILIFPSVLKGEQGAWEVFIGVLLMGIIFGAIGVAIPNQQYVWVHYLLYPIGNFVLILTAILIADKLWGTRT